MAIGISMIMLTADAPICAEDLHQQLAEYWRGLPPVSEFNEDDGTLPHLWFVYPGAVLCGGQRARAQCLDVGNA